MFSSLSKLRLNKKKNMKLKKKPTCANYFREYCEATSIHGFRYFGEKRPIFERIWWTLVFIICLVGCCFMIYTIYEKYEKSPVIVTFATKETPIYKIPFPAVTICPEIKSKKIKFNYEKAIQNSNNTEKLLDYMSLLCDNHNLVTHGNKSFDLDFLNTINEIKPNFLDNLSNCNFMGKSLNCNEIFTPLLTDEGICYSFNILDRSQIFNDLVSHYKNFHQTKEKNYTWSIDKGYINQSKFDIYPRRALLAGAINGLTVFIKTPKEDIDFFCKEVQGYKVILHTPMRMPRLKQEFFLVPLDEAVLTAVKPIMISTSEAVKTYDIKKRDCCYPFERKLQFFQTYSQLNCQLECLANFTLKTCNCVNYYMPRTNNTKICGSGSYNCTILAQSLLQSEGLSEKFEEIKTVNVDCNCLPLCTDLSYQTETSQTSWNWRRINQNYNKDLIHFSSLTVYFKFNHFITSERNELYGPTDFLANFGGLLGLFTGFSILSLMEIIYFLTIRIWKRDK